jgi:EAL domain-containing protein (putative c-di-GMP-specific phosphodiesterase class I)
MTTDEILKSADVALYKAKRNGRGNFAFFDAAEDAGACSARRLESELRRAVEDKEFRVVYQPIRHGTDGNVAALEALIRWHHPELGTISPAEFIPLAERNGLISEIGDWVLDQACRDAMRLPPDVKISVNLSRVQVSDPAFVKRVSETLQRTGLAPDRLELEVTETAILHNEVSACAVLLDLQALGVSVAIDDFGVGQTALSCLKSLPIGRIKIDRSIIDDLATDAKARSIFVAVVSLAKSLGIKTTAEGIETEQQRIIAALAGCDHLQGYLLGRPQDIEGLALHADSGSSKNERLLEEAG